MVQTEHGLLALGTTVSDAAGHSGCESFWGTKLQCPKWACGGCEMAQRVFSHHQCYEYNLRWGPLVDPMAGEEQRPVDKTSVEVHWGEGGREYEREEENKGGETGGREREKRDRVRKLPPQKERK